MPKGCSFTKTSLLASTAAMGLLFLPQAGLADRADQLLGDENIRPVVRTIIDESLGDAMGYKAIKKKVNSGQLPPSQGVKQMVKQAEMNVKDILNRLGVRGDNPAAKDIADSFVKARVSAKETDNIKLPVPKGKVRNPMANLPAARHTADGKDPGLKMDKKMLSLEKQQENLKKKISHSIETRPHLHRHKFDTDNTHSHIDLSNVTTPHERAHIDRSKIDHAGTDHGGADRPTFNRPDISRAGTLPPGIDENVRPAIDRSSIKRPSVDVDGATGAARDAAGSASGAGRGANGGADIDTDNIENNISSATDDISKDSISQKIDQGDINQDVPGQQDIDDMTQDVDDSVDDMEQSVDDATAAVDQQVDGLSEKVDPDSITQKVDQGVQLGDLGQEVKQKVSIDSLSKQAGFTLDKDGIRDQISKKLDPALEKVHQKVKDATAQAFGKVNGFFEDQIASKQSDYNDKKSDYDSISIPSKKYHSVCTTKVVICWHHKDVETSDSVKARSKATAKKKTAEGEMDAAKKELDRYNGAYDKVKTNETSVNSNIDSLFAGATQEVDTASGSSSDNTDPNAPADKKSHTVTQSGDDRKVVDIQSSVTDNIVAAGAIAASIGDETVAIVNLGNIGGGLEDTEVRGAITEEIVVPGVISAAIGYESSSAVEAANLQGTVGGTMARNINGAGLLAASIGAYSDASVTVGNLYGDIQGSGKQVITTVGAIAASIGADTEAIVAAGNMAEGASVGSLNQTITQLSPSIAAAIGYDSDAEISVGNITGDVSGSVDQTITIGNMISASIGAHTVARGRVGDINSTVNGHVSQTITTGEVLNVAIGVNTEAKTDIGVIDAPVYGDVNQTITIGDATSITVGSHTKANTFIGSVYAPVYGNYETDIVVGDINTFSIGLGIGDVDDISAHTAVGSIFETVHNPGKITVHTGAIVSLGFGFDIDLGPLGDFRIVEQGCEAGVRLGNVGSPC